ncbi:MAG: LPS assembly lipoprotein LptE [Dehalococcoidia bacterium]
MLSSAKRQAPSVLRAVVLMTLIPLTQGGCLYSFQAGAGFPPHVQTLAVLPFDNETGRFELTGEIHQVLLRDLPRALGVRSAGADVADAILRGSVRRYSVDAPLYRPGADGQRAEVVERQVTLALQVEIIDVRDNVILWEDGNLSAQGQFLEQGEVEEVGRDEAIALLVQRIVDGAQSNW